MTALSSLKTRTAHAKNVALTRAQIDRPVLAGKVIRKLTGSSGKKTSGKDATSASPEHAAHVSGVEAAKLAAGVPDAPVTEAPTRTNGIEAAKHAAGVPATH
jgi:hypothetical protein